MGRYHITILLSVFIATSLCSCHRERKKPGFRTENLRVSTKPPATKLKLSGFESTPKKRAKGVMQDNELERKEMGLERNFHCNPLLLDGKPLDYGNFTINSKGILTLVKGEPASIEPVKIPFSLWLRRNGEILDPKNLGFSSLEFYEIEISKILSFGKLGDQLIINPINHVDWKAKRILNLVL